MTVSDNTLSNIGRIGIYMYGAGVTNGVVTNNTFTGKGTGNWLDYGIEVEGAAHGVITGNTVTECTGCRLGRRFDLGRRACDHVFGCRDAGRRQRTTRSRTIRRTGDRV